MIIPLPFIVSLLFTITYATDFDYNIDLTRCKEDMTCYIRKSCRSNIADTDTAAVTVLDLFKEDVDILKDFDGGKDCDVVVQMKALAPSKYLVLMQIKKSQTDLDYAKGIVIKQNGADQIDCKDGTLIGNSFFNFVRKGASSNIFDATKMFCSFTMETTEKDGDDLRLVPFHFQKLDDIPSLTYFDTNNIEAIISYEFKKAKFWTVTNERCEGEPKTSDKDDSAYNLAEVDTTKLLIKCPDGAKVLLKYKDAEAIEVDEVVCDGQSWKWNGGPTKVVASDELELYCIKTKYCTACTEPTAFSRDECPTCEALPDTPNDENGCKVRKCPDDMFTIDGQEEVKSTKGITCEKKSDGTGSEWLIHNTDGGNVVDGKVSCYKFKGCRPLTKLNCPEGVECKTGPVFNQEIFNYTCPDADAVLHQNKELVTPSCDKETHEWKGIDNTVDLYCAVGQTKTDASKGDGETKTGGSGLTIGLAVVGSLVAVAAIAGGAYYMLVIRKRQEAKKTTKKEEGTSKKSSKKVQSKSGAAGSSNEAKKEEKKSDPNKESEKPAAEAAKEAPKDGKEAPKEGAEAAKEPPKDAAATPAAAATPGAPPTPAAPATPATPAADSAPAPADATPV